MKQKAFDCVELQREIRSKLVREAEEDLNKFYKLIQSNRLKSPVYQKLVNRKEKEKQLTTV